MESARPASAETRKARVHRTPGSESIRGCNGDRQAASKSRKQASRKGSKQSMATKIITHAELDERLDGLASAPEAFVAGSLTLAAELDRAGLGLEVTDPLSWRRPTTPEQAASRVTLAQQFRREVDAMIVLDREPEARLARRIEFARIRFERAVQAAGLEASDVLQGVSTGTSGFTGGYTLNCKLPADLCRRWLELHTLRTEMVERNLYLVLINVERYSHTTASQGDLIQEGSGALFRAVDGFDWRRGLLFRTYAVHWLNQAFRSYLYNFTNTVRVPVYLQKALKHVNDAKNRLGDSKASVEKIAAEAQLGEHLVAAAMASARSSRSIDMSFDDEGEGGRLKDLLQTPVDEDGPYTTALEDVSLEESLGEALDRLSDRERYVVTLRFGVGVEREHTLAEVAAKLGVSLERVRQIQVRALGKLNSPQLRKVADPFLN
jgi:RNA polymerase sigma factor (sigma-70 family)